MYLNNFEEKIISTFHKNLDKLMGKTLLLKWDSGHITGAFDTCFEDMDDKASEEFYSFVFLVFSKEGNPPVVISDDNYCLINYKNFPIEILLDSKKLN